MQQTVFHHHTATWMRFGDWCQRKTTEILLQTNPHEITGCYGGVEDEEQVGALKRGEATLRPFFISYRSSKEKSQRF